MNIPKINTKRDLDNVIQELRLMHIPFCLETLKSIRSAISKDSLDTMLKKTIEREFANQWKDVLKRNHLIGWPINLQSSFKTENESNSLTISTGFIFLNPDDEGEKESNLNKATKKEKKKEKKSEKQEKKNALQRTLKTNGRLELPRLICTPKDIEYVLGLLKAQPYQITKENVQLIERRILDERLIVPFEQKVELLSIKLGQKFRRKELRVPQLTKSQKKKANPFSLGDLKVSPKKKKRFFTSQGSGVPLTSHSLPLSLHKKDDGNMYDSFEYGLSDW